MEQKRMVASETNALLDLFAAAKAVKNAEVLEKRLRTLPRGWQMFKSIQGQIEKLIALVELSMPREQMYSVERNASTLTYRIAVKSPGGRSNADNGRWLSLEAIDEMCEAANNVCALCTKDVQEQRKCKLAKALDELPMKKADEKHHGCRYHNGLF